MYTIEKNIRKLIQSKGLSVEELAEKVGVSVKTFYNNFNKNDYKSSLLYRTAEELKVDITDLVKEELEIGNIHIEQLVTDFNDLTEDNKAEILGKISYLITKQEYLSSIKG